MTGNFGSFEHALAARYRFESELGRGAMGIVYRAHDLTLGRTVAIKMLHPVLTNEVGAARFQSEIRIAATLRHPNMVAVHDSGEADGRLYYVMDDIGGETLRALLQREKQLSSAQALSIATDVGAALQFAHDRGIVHRDVKPENILIADGRACILDFGLARIIGNAGADRLTASGLSVGTPHYLSPEQASAERDVGPRADQYALACVVYEMLVGEPPFTGPTASAIAMRHISEPPPPMRLRRRTISRNIEAAVMRALEKVPADRFSDVTAFLTALESTALDDTPVADLPAVTGASTDSWRRSWRRHWRWVAAVGVLVLAGATAALYPRFKRGSGDVPRSIMIFPLQLKFPVSAEQHDIGESAALLIGYRLEGTPGMQFSNGSDYLVGDERTGRQGLTLEHMSEIAGSVGADRFIGGWVQRDGDSLTVVLRVHRTDGSSPSIQQGYTALASPADAPRLALVALRALLPAFLATGQRVDLSALEQREPAAIAAFLEGERAYRASHFDTAFTRYAAAIARDSLLAVAALKAAQASSWLTETADAVEYSDLAMRHVDLLPPRYATYATTLQHYLRGEGDSAVAGARGLVAEDPRWTDAWFLLGESYFHLVTTNQASSQTALADSAFRMARRTDPSFTPPIIHLMDLALRRGDIRQIDALYPAVKALKDPGDIPMLDAIVRCVRRGPGAVNWKAIGGAKAKNAWQWGETLVFDPAGGPCARAAFAATLASREAEPYDQWGALVATNASLMAAGRDEELGRLLTTPVAANMRGLTLLLPDVAAGARLAPQAQHKVDSLGTNYASLTSLQLWLLTAWHSSRRDAAALERIGGVMSARRDSTHLHLDSVVANVSQAHLAAARGDTTGALRLLAALVPAATYDALMWQPWEAYAGERMLEASLLAGRGQHAEAIRAASRLDVHVPMINLVYLRRSLELRERSARQLGDASAAERYRRELGRWAGESK